MLERCRIECVKALDRPEIGTRLSHIKLSIEDQRHRTDETTLRAVANPEVPEQLAIQRIESNQVTVQGASDHHAFVERDTAIRREELHAGRRIFVRPSL